MKEQNGFTLIETLVYIVLLAIVMGGILMVTYQLVEGTDRTLAKVIEEEEANFILRKIDWALSNVDDINLPVSGSGATLSVDKIGYGSNPIAFDLSGGAFRVSKGGGAPVDLTTSNVAVSSLSFQRVTVPGQPEQIVVTFDLNGQPYSMTRTLRHD
ncbi:MAG: hypothetical protein A2846_04340 [Candidatus Doudnabacteria bacterium RIFCSPHIGHO2_01_FULL_49_9]|uniref:Prepilin-type N-terminal cleavage/methylation domain-containing protein n=1 Tax=Candidatus Doudnabacteria bacterium RIFCSPHIGHO2_01_FULL_49_9 TaxID=1817827 RepID=A0A1F5NYW9_9BACT|nr:MAG: hypothetical protein A2846_04340 [Candidatus Doudnabacteria bacterium RIFCSPHIGHO2_01_FULL_49_9]